MRIHSDEERQVTVAAPAGEAQAFWVRTGGRLHLGQLDLNGSLGRLYGGIGIAIEDPQIEVTARRCDRLELLCSQEGKPRLQRIAGDYLRTYALPGVSVELQHDLPSHSGLGSGTALALATGLAITRVYGLEVSIAELAGVTDREGSRSGLGVAAFEHGGALVDGGRCVTPPSHNGHSQIPPLLARVAFPDEWRIVLVLQDGTRMYGKKEENAFRALAPMREQISAEICRNVVMKLLPSLSEHDLNGFGAAVDTIQADLGAYFSAAQGGAYSCTEGESIAQRLRESGAVGVGQSSWGPTIYGFVLEDCASQVVAKMREALGNGSIVWATRGRNNGATWGWR